MALQTNYIFNGIPLINAYFRIRDCNILKNDKGNYTMQLLVETHASKDLPVIEINSYITIFDINITDNAIIQAYNYLKTLTIFSTAINV